MMHWRPLLEHLHQHEWQTNKPKNFIATYIAYSPFCTVPTGFFISSKDHLPSTFISQDLRLEEMMNEDGNIDADPFRDSSEYES